MSEAAPDTAPETPEQPQEGEPEPFDAERAQQKIAKANAEAKNLRTRLKELEDQRKASMTESERAVIEAEERGRKSAITQYGERLAKTEFIAEAAKRNPGFDAAAVLDDINLARYIGEDGEPDSKAIAAAVGRLVPEGSTGPTPPPSFDGGTRQTASGSPSMSQLIRQAAGRA